MPAAQATNGKRETLNIRIKSELRGLIDRAARVQGKTRTDFVLEAARLAAEEALADRALILVDPGAYTAFLDRLEKPPQSNERLRATMRTAPPWEGA